MAEITSSDFRQLIQEQQRTNVLIEQGNKDPNLASSIKQNLGEILNASRLQGRSETFAKDEGTTEVDEKVDALKDVNKTFLQQILDKITGIIKLTPSISLRMSQKKGEESLLKRLFAPFKGIKKDFTDFFGFLTNEKGGLFDFGGFIGKTKLFALLAALPLLLNSTLFKQMLETIDTIIGFLPKVNEFLRPVGEKIDAIGEFVGIEKLTDVLGDIAIAAGAFAVFSKKFRTRLIKFLSIINPRSKKFFLYRIFRFLGLGAKDITKAAKGNKVKGGVLKQIGGFFKELFKGMGKVLTKNIGSILKGAFIALRIGFLSIPFIGTIITGIIGVLTGLVKGVKVLLDGGSFKEAGKAFIDGFIGSITELFTFPIRLFKKFFPETSEKISNFFTELFQPIKKMIKTQMIIFKEIKEGFFDTIDNVVNFFRQIKAFFVEKKMDVKQKFFNTIDTVKEKIDSIVDFFTKIALFVQNFKLSDVKLPTINFDFIDDVLLFFKAIGKGAGSALRAALPGGKTPQEAFMETFQKVIDSGSQNITPTSDLGSNADAMNENALNKGGEGMTTIVNNVNQNNSNDVKQDVVNNHSKQIAHNNALHTSIASSG